MTEKPEYNSVEPDPEVKAELAEAAGLGDGGAERMIEEIEQYTDRSPQLAGGDVDAAWQDDTGEELAGGSAPTPDQDIVEEIGEAYGLTYQDNEPLHTAEKLEERDNDRWELNPASAEDFGSNTDQ